MFQIWKCPHGHLNSFRVTEHSPDINYQEAEDKPCEECDLPFDSDTWQFVDIDYDSSAEE